MQSGMLESLLRFEPSTPELQIVFVTSSATSLIHKILWGDFQPEGGARISTYKLRNILKHFK